MLGAAPPTAAMTSSASNLALHDQLQTSSQARAQCSFSDIPLQAYLLELELGSLWAAMSRMAPEAVDTATAPLDDPQQPRSCSQPPYQLR